MTVRKKTILIVDDSAIILDRLTVKLRKLDSVGAILTAQTYASALQLLAGAPVDVAVFDIHLEDKSGIELLRATRRQHPGVVIIMLTNQAGEQVETLCKELGAAWFLDKSRDFIRIPGIISSIA